MTVFLGFLVSSIREIDVPYVFGNTEHLCTECRGIGPHLAANGKSHESSRVAAGTWGIFSSYTGDGHLKFGFVREVWTPVYLGRTPQESKVGLAGQYGCF